ncbi:MAG TPA: glycoside hydrolase family 32 protein [Chloroflexota bacterium]|nr:glycoside hydrolase family 32 protein [Chloroflexota bacterium]
MNVEIAGERYRPRFHFTPPSGWINDPNGLVYFDGEYHLFYQHLPRKHWGHAVSTDLVHWAHLPIALYPDDLGQIYSGSVVVDEEDSSGFFHGHPGLVAIFTHANHAPPPSGPQVQSIAYSSDRGRTWIKYAGNPVITNFGNPDFRDPKVRWHGATQQWVLVLACGNRVRFYLSSNLKDWSYASEFGAGHGVQNVPWECPDLFELPVDGDSGCQKWVLQVSVYQRHGRIDIPGYRDMQYFIGDFDGVTFTNDNPPQSILWTEYGRDNYAPVSWSNIPDTDGRRLWLGWMSNWEYARDLPTAPWSGAMSLPRQVRLRTLAEGVRLTQQPVSELAVLRERTTSWSDLSITPAAPFLIEEPGATLEIVAMFQLGTAAECGLNLHTGETDHTVIGYDANGEHLFIDRAHSGETRFNPAFPGRHGGPMLATDGMVTLHIFVDSCSIEVFGNDGSAVVTSLIFPRSDTRRLEIYAIGGDVRLVSLDLHRLCSL